MEESDFWKENEWIMYHVTKGLYAPGWTFDDLLNEARVGLWEASLSWKPEHGTKWSTYAYVVAKRRVMDLVTTSLRKKNEFLRNFTDIDVSGAHNIPEYVDVNYSKHFVAELLDRVELSSVEKDVIDLWLLSYTYKEIAQQLGISRRTVDNAYQRVLKKLKQLRNPHT